MPEAAFTTRWRNRNYLYAWRNVAARVKSWPGRSIPLLYTAYFPWSEERKKLG